MIPEIFDSEYRFCQIVWGREPIKSTDLVKICEKELSWKKSTTYTVLRRLVERGILKNENAVVSSLVSKSEAQVSKINDMVEKTFNGSLPMFISAFTKNQELSKEDIDSIRRMIDSYEEDNNE